MTKCESTSKINEESIREHVAAELAMSRSGRREHSRVLQDILDNLEAVDFRKVSGRKDGDAVTGKLEIVVTIDEILSTAKQLNCELCKDQGFIYAYNGEYWRQIEQDELGHFLVEASIRLGVDVIASKYHRRRKEMQVQFFDTAKLEKSQRESDTARINLQNCTLEITPSGPRRLAFDPRHFLKYQLSFAYDENTECPQWKAFLDEVLVTKNVEGKIVPDISKQNVLAEFFGYVFARHLKLEKTLILYGEGANGKSVVFDVINAVFGKENISNVSLESICNDQYYRAMLANKLLNYASEISNRLLTDRFKQLSSGEPIEARLPYGKPMILTDYARLVFNCNQLPKDIEHTRAFFRRFLIIPFDVTIPEERRDPFLAKRIIESELSGVFNWILAGLDRLIKQNGFSKCDAGERILNQFRLERDSVAMFLRDEGYRRSVNCSTPLKALYNEYQRFCIESGFRTVSLVTLAKRLGTLGFDKKKFSAGVVIYLEK